MTDPRVTAELASSLGIPELRFAHLIEMLGRDPTYIEIRILGAYWRHISSNTFVDTFLDSLATQSIDSRMIYENEKPSLIEVAPDSILKIKIVTKSVRSETSADQSVRECTLGALRKMMESGVQPISIFYSRNIGSPEAKGVKSIATRLRRGVEACGSNLDVEAINSEIFFDESFDRNALISVIIVGEAPKIQDYIQTIPSVGSSVCFLSGKLSRANAFDLSMEKTLSSMSNKLVRRSYLLALKSIPVSGIGTACADLAVLMGCGITINASRIPVDEGGQSPSEVLLLERTVGLLVMINKGFEKELKQLASEYHMKCNKIGQVNSEANLNIRWNRKKCCTLPLNVLKDCPDSLPQNPDTTPPQYLTEVGQLDISTIKKPKSYKNVLFSLLQSPNVLETGRLIERKEMPPNFFAVESDSQIILEMRSSGRHMYLNPRTGGKSALAGAARRIVCRGATPMAAVINYFAGHLSEPGAFYVLREAMEGFEEARSSLDIIVVNREVEFISDGVFPTTIVGVLGEIPESTCAITPEFKTAGDFILMLGSHRGELGGSEYLRILHKRFEGTPPTVDTSMERRIHEIILVANRVNLIKSAHDVSFGGLAITISHCLLNAPEGLGARIHVSSKISNDELLFGETQGLIIITVAEDSIIEIERLCMRMGISCTAIGRVTDSCQFSFNDLIDISVKDLVKVHRNGVKKLLT